jgi:hypothetical protein
MAPKKNLIKIRFAVNLKIIFFNARAGYFLIFFGPVLTNLITVGYPSTILTNRLRLFIGSKWQNFNFNLIIFSIFYLEHGPSLSSRTRLKQKKKNYPLGSQGFISLDLTISGPRTCMWIDDKGMRKGITWADAWKGSQIGIPKWYPSDTQRFFYAPSTLLYAPRFFAWLTSCSLTPVLYKFPLCCG